MTHTLHRLLFEEVDGDFVIFFDTESGINQEGSTAQKRELVDVFHAYNPVNMGDMKPGNLCNLDLDNLKSNITDNSAFHAVYDTKEKIAGVLREIKEIDSGLCIVVTGHSPTVERICHELGLEIHTIEHSLGVFGDKTFLAQSKYRRITTMCGHGVVSKQLVKKTVEDIKQGRITLEEGAEKLALPCQCGVLNTAKAKRALELLLD